MIEIGIGFSLQQLTGAGSSVTPDPLPETNRVLFSNGDTVLWGNDDAITWGDD